MDDHLNAPTRVRPVLDLGLDPETSDAVQTLATTVAAAGGRALVVGGAVRDAVVAARTGFAPAGKDVDVEVFGIEPDRLAALVASLHRDVSDVGASFGVLTVNRLGLDVSVPRRERKTGTGHRGFAVDADPWMPVVEAAQRRDFTMNAMSFDPLSGELIDPTGGEADLSAGRLRHVSDRFAEDPLRVLRAAQFAARFDLDVSPSTVALCASLVDEAATLPAERVATETVKLVTRGAVPSRGLALLEACGWLAAVHPELAALRGVEQDPVWHPEGDVLTHTAHVVDFFAANLRTGDTADDTVVGLACLAHDFGKATTTEFRDGKWRAHGHEAAGVAPAAEWLGRVGLGQHRHLVAELVAHHLAPVQLHAADASDRAVRRLSTKVSRLDLLVSVAHADQGGRPPKVLGQFEAGQWLTATAAELGVTRGAPSALASGRTLIAAGAKPGPAFKVLLEQVYTAQLDGEVNTPDEANAMLVDLARSAGVVD
jgi:tRNA nucleotidyltransferase (CCA-adding enzyme)